MCSVLIFCSIQTCHVDFSDFATPALILMFNGFEKLGVSLISVVLNVARNAQICITGGTCKIEQARSSPSGAYAVSSATSGTSHVGRK